MSLNKHRRELQIARNIVTLRWASIPVVFCFCLIFLHVFKMSFKIEPVYIICCVLAVFNIYLTLHISMIGRQLAVTRGLTTLKRLMGKVLSQFFGGIKSKGITALAGFPKTIGKMIAVVYLMVLETFKDFPVNPLSLDNIMHFQVIFDIAIALCLTRYTGSTESPMFFMAAIPVAVAGSIINTKAGIIYAVIACGGWFANSMLIKYGIMDHIKFFSPSVGDLSSCTGWIHSYTLVALFSMVSFALVSHKLTEAFKEMVADLDKSLNESRSTSIANNQVSLLEPNPWIIVNTKGIVESVKSDRAGLLNGNMVGKVVIECLPELKDKSFAEAVKDVFKTKIRTSIPGIRFVFDEKDEHIYDLAITCFKDNDNSEKIIIFFEEKTIEIRRKDQIDSLASDLANLNTNYEKVTCENLELHKSIENLKKQSDDKSIEIDVLNTKVNDLDIEAVNQNSRISELMDEVASVKSKNDQLKVEINNHKMILEDVTELMESCGDLEALIAKLEQRTRDMFGLENSCFHVFDSNDIGHQRGEILDMRKVSPRLLDIPRSHPETLDPALTEGRPVVFSAEFRPEKASASLSITNGDLKRLVAFVPLKENEKVLGMMMLEKYGIGNNSENIVDMVSFYLKQAAGVVKNAIENKRMMESNRSLHQEILKLHTRLDSVKSMINDDGVDDSVPFYKMLHEIAKITPVKDIVLARMLSDGSKAVWSRIDRSKDFVLSNVENEIFKNLEGNFENKVTFKAENGIDDCVAYPLADSGRLLGVLYVYNNDITDNSGQSAIDCYINMLRNKFALYILNEERSAWASFYAGGVPA